MAETLGSLCDKLTIVKLKQWHTGQQNKLKNLEDQEEQLQQEISEFIADAVSGKTPVDRLTFASNKVYTKKGNAITKIRGTIGEVFSKLVDINCLLWHEQEKIYDFENVPAEEKDKIVKCLALLNLERNKCIDNIDKQFRAAIEQLRLG